MCVHVTVVSAQLRRHTHNTTYILSYSIARLTRALGNWGKGHCEMNSGDDANQAGNKILGNRDGMTSIELLRELERLSLMERVVSARSWAAQSSTFKRTLTVKNSNILLYWKGFKRIASICAGWLGIKRQFILKII